MKKPKKYPHIIQVLIMNEKEFDKIEQKWTKLQLSRSSYFRVLAGLTENVPGVKKKENK